MDETDRAGVAYNGVTYDLTAAYVDRSGDVWFFTDTVSAKDGTPHMTSSADPYLHSLAEVEKEWGPLVAHRTAQTIDQGLEQLFRRLGPPNEQEN